ncbi:integrase [Prolixibacter bellariivorans]|uniref:Integrase n=1 Tax=Prolixibacter bellariivorans TaxID=314319 RepID=A0A5M4B5T0_9BACT|nr:tyrosine-type recombinase/integrase [Prolixibacter bellariivorans]GET35251.1 integrase [Prolixibacter bellariivorans]
MEAIEKFLFHCEFEKRLSSKTLKAYSIDLAQFKSHMLTQYGLTDVSQIGKEELKHYVQFLSRFKPKTIKRKLAATKAMFNFLEFEEFIETNPFRKVRIRIKEPKVLPRVMNIEEITQLFQAAYRELRDMEGKPDSYAYMEKVRDVAVFELLFGTGVRVSELCSLKYADIGIDFSSVRVNGKGSKERNIQIINADIKRALRNYYRLFSAVIGTQEYFFINRFGNRLSEQSVRLMIRKYRKKCNITKNVTPHVFRHTFATLLLEQDVDIKYIQNILGHSSILTTQIYTHVSTEKQTEILEKKHPRNDLVVVR